MTSTRAASKSPLVVIFITIFVDLVGFGIIIPQSPYFARQFGASATEVGWLMAIYSGFQFMFAPYWGALSDRYGRRPILLISLMGGALSYLLFFLAPNLLMLFAARALAGLFGANISTAMAAIADLTSPEERSKGMGIIGAAFGLGFVLGPAIGGVVAHWNEAYPPLAASLICGLNFLLALRVLPETLKKENRNFQARGRRIQKIVSCIRRPVFGYLLVGFFLTGLAMANMEAPMFLLLQDRFSWNVVTSSYAFAYIGLWIAFTQGFLIRRLIPLWGERRLLLIGLIIFSIGLMGIGLSPTVPLMALSVTFLAVGSGFTNPSLMGSVSLLSSPEEQGEIMGVMQSLAALARIIGPPIGGWLYGNMGISVPFLAAATFGALAWLLLFTQRKNIPSRGKTSPV